MPKIKKVLTCLIIIFILFFNFARFFPTPVRAGAITNISYPSSGSVVSTFVPDSSNLVSFTPATALADESIITVTFPVGTTLNGANISKNDFKIVQASGGGCPDPGSDTKPSAVTTNETNRTISFTVDYHSLSESGGDTCGLGEVTIKMLGAAGGDEIQHPSTPTTTGVLQIDSSEGGDTGSISNVAFVSAGGGITNISYPPSGSTVATFVPVSSNLLLFTPETPLVAGSVITVTFPAGTTINSANTKKSDFFIKQTAGGSCTSDGTDTQPNAITINESLGIIYFTIANGSLSKDGTDCGEGEVVIKMRDAAGGDEIQHPSTPTTTGVLQIDSSEGSDTGSISNVTFVVGDPTKLVFTTQPSFFATTNQDFGSQPAVSIQDDAGNTIDTSTDSITISAVLATDTGTSGSGTLNATSNPLDATAGVATFTGVNYTDDEDIKLKATASGLTTAYSDPVLVSVPDSTPPEIVSVAPIEDTSSATVTWDTNEDASSQVEYGLTEDLGSTTQEEDTVSRIKNHSIVIPSLAACTKYNYRAKSTDRANNKKDGDKKKLVTKGCPGNASVISDTDSNIDSASGGTVSLLQGGKGVTVVAPPHYSASTANIQVKKLEKNAVLGAISTPDSHQAVGDHIYDLKAFTGVSSTLTSFSQPMIITISYTDADLGKVNDELSLRIYRHDGSSWNKLSNCSVNTIAKEVTCTTTSFSVFGLFGAIFASSSGPPVCEDQSPGTNPPWLYSATPESTTSIRLRFTKGDEPFDKYVLEYGTSSGKYIFAADNIGSKEMGSFLVRSLEPHTIYYFRIRAGNGCAVGPWSNEIFATTESSLKKAIKTSDLEVTTSEGDSEIPKGKYRITVKIVDQKGEPIKGVKVVLFTAPQEKITDKEGKVEFNNIDPGNHRLIINYQDQQSEHTINLSGKDQQVNITLSIQKKTNVVLAISLIIVSIFLLWVGIHFFSTKEKA